MSLFHIDVRVVGYAQVAVKAESQEEAVDKALDSVMKYTVQDLRMKEASCSLLGVEKGTKE